MSECHSDFASLRSSRQVAALPLKGGVAHLRETLESLVAENSRLRAENRQQQMAIHGPLPDAAKLISGSGSEAPTAAINLRPPDGQTDQRELQDLLDLRHVLDAIKPGMQCQPTSEPVLTPDMVQEQEPSHPEPELEPEPEPEPETAVGTEIPSLKLKLPMRQHMVVGHHMRMDSVDSQDSLSSRFTADAERRVAARAAEPLLYSPRGLAAERQQLAEEWASLDAAKAQLQQQELELADKVQKLEMVDATSKDRPIDEGVAKASMVDSAVQCPVDGTSIEAEVLQAEAETLIRKVNGRRGRSRVKAVTALEQPQVSRGGHPRRVPAPPSSGRRPGAGCTDGDDAGYRDDAITVVVRH
eukprot:SAG31_NODE_1025_length_10289_cov_3.290677_6_plen_357_part_00